MKEDLESLRAEFLSKFASVPAPLRNEIVAVVEKQPFTWASAYLEVSQKTRLGDGILTVLKNLKIIK